MAENKSKWWPLGRVIPHKTNFKFVGFAIPAALLSIVVCAISIGSLAISIANFPRLHPWGLNFGVDFKGGNLIEIEAPRAIDLDKVRTALSGMDLGDVQAQDFGAPNLALVRFETPSGAPAGEVVEHAQDALKKAIPDVKVRRVESVGPKVSKELMTGGLLALFGAILMQLAYVWFRFEWQFGVAAIVTTAHDVIMTVGLFSLTGLEFNLSSIAAVLTLVGLSLNETVVISDRVRENLRKYKKMELRDIINMSINQTIVRTSLTQFTVLLALFPLVFFGGESIRGFTIAMTFGSIFGMYSSVLVGGPILIFFNLRAKAELTEAEKAKATKRADGAVV
jgi:SecD/SecF fusion protein